MTKPFELVMYLVDKRVSLCIHVNRQLMGLNLALATMED